MWWLPPQSKIASADSGPAVHRRGRLIDTLTAQQRQANLELSAAVHGGNETEVTQLQQDIASLEASIRQRVDESQRAQNQADRLGEELSKSQARLTLANEVASAASVSQQQTVDHLKAEIDDRERLLGELEAEYTNLEHHLAFYRDRANQLQDAANKSQDETEYQIDSLQAQHDKLRSDHARLSRETSLLQSQNDQFHQVTLAARAKRDRAERQINALQQTSQGTQEDWQQLILANQNLQSQLTQQTQQLTELEPLRDKLAETERRAQQWQIETQRSNAAKSGLVGKCDRLQAFCADLESRLVDREQQITKLTNQQSEESGEVTKQLAVVRLKADRLAIELKQKKRHRDLLAQRIKNQQENHRAEIARQQETVAQTRQSLEVTLAKAAQFEQKNQQRDQVINHLRQNEERMAEVQSSQFESLTARIEELLVEVDDQRTLLNRNELETERVLMDHSIEVRELTRVCDQSARQMADLTAVNDELEYELSRLRAQLASGSANQRLLIDQYESQLARRDDQIARLSADHSSLPPNRAA